jgi:hypothetical protein
MVSIVVLYSIRSLMLSIAENDLRCMFNRFGKIRSVRIIVRFRLYAFIEFAARHEALRAIRGVDGSIIRGYSIVVTLSNRSRSQEDFIDRPVHRSIKRHREGDTYPRSRYYSPGRDRKCTRVNEDGPYSAVDSRSPFTVIDSRGHCGCTSSHRTAVTGSTRASQSAANPAWTSFAAPTAATPTSCLAAGAAPAFAPGKFYYEDTFCCCAHLSLH